jgi:probable rRNA maturation factor
VSSRISVSVTGAVETRGIVSLRWLGQRLREVAARLRVQALRLGVIVTGDEYMAQLHGTYCGDHQTTDVLTFDLSEGGSATVEGEIYICLDEARRRAAERGHAPRLELLLYAVHGLLHLLGHEDHSPRGFAQMHRKEDAVLQAIGVGAVFAGPPRRITRGTLP